MEMAMLICLAVIFGIIALGTMIIKAVTVDFQYNDLDSFIYISMGVSIILYMLSYFISVAIYKRKAIA